MNQQALSSRSTFSATVAALLAIGGCGAAAAPQPLAPTVSAAITTRGETVYFGTVYPLGERDATAVFRYERRVLERGGKWVSTHVTRDPGGHVAVAESALHGPDYALEAYTLYADQAGRSGSVRVDGDRVTFRFVAGGEERTRVEEQKGTVVVGPTLVGVIARSLPTLRARGVVPVRLAVLERLETIGFELSAVDAPAGETRVRMKPTSFLIGLIVDPLHFTFDDASGKLTRLEGRVPPKIMKRGALRDLDARVEYDYVAAAYR